MYKVLIADDEELTCRALEMMLKNAYSDLQVLPGAKNGAELLRMVETLKPDIIIVDINMPELNGLEAIELIRMKNKRVKIIICTAYSDFEYIRKAFRADATDYLLKPVKQTELLSVINRILQQLNAEQLRVDEQEESRRQNQEMREILGENLLTSLLFGEPDRKSFDFYFSMSGKVFSGAEVLAVRRDVSEGAGSEFFLQENVVREIVKEMNQYCSCVGKLYRGVLYLLLFPDGTERQNSYRIWVSDFAQILLMTIRRVSGMEVCCGISAMKYALEDISNGLTECRIALDGKQTGQIRFFERAGNLRNPFCGKESLYLKLLRSGDRTAYLSEIENTMLDVEWSAETIAAMRVFILDFVHRLLEQALYDADIIAKYGKEQQIDWEGLSKCLSREQMQKWMTGSLDKIQDIFARKEKIAGKEYIMRAILYMEEKYMTDLSLTQTAENVGISSFYLSRLFTQELSQNFTEILTTIRIRRALVLLRDKNNSVKEIASQAGFQNISYFYKVFKKNCGVNIGEMKEILNGRE
ncbi:MAG: response regulator [Lachnospiraceae bacterium]|nr:response regulator [Lachnospiraceae bacterium]